MGCLMSTTRRCLATEVLVFNFTVSFNTTRKAPVFGFILVRIFTHSDWIRKGTSYFDIQSECGKLWTRITPNTDTFYAVQVVPLLLLSLQYLIEPKRVIKFKLCINLILLYILKENQMLLRQYKLQITVAVSLI